MKISPQQLVRIDASISTALEDGRVRWCFEWIQRAASGVERAVDMLAGPPGAGRSRRAPLLAVVLMVGVLVATSSSKAIPLPPPLPGPHAVGFLDFILTSSDGTFSRWMMTARGYALGLFTPLLLMQFVLAVKGKDGVFEVFSSLVDVVMRKGIWAWFLMDAESIAIGIMQGLEHVGMTIAGSNVHGSPSHLAGIGKAACANIVNAAWDGGLMSITGPGLMAVATGGFVFLVFLGCSWTLALTMLYVKVVAAGGLLIVGLAGLDVTSRYAWKYVEFLVRGGFKLLGASLVMGLSTTFTEYWGSTAGNASFWTGDVHLLALDMACGCFGLLVLLLLVPQISSSMVSGSIGDTGEGRIGGAIAAATQSAATAGTAWALGKMMSSGGAGAVAGTGAAESPEQRAAKLVQAAAGGGGGGGGGKGSGAGQSSGCAPRKPSGGGAAASGAGVSASAQSVGRTVGAMTRGVQHAHAEEAEDE